MDLDQLASLRTPEGEAALAAAAALADTDSLAAATALRAHGFPAELANAALTQVALRRKAALKFGAHADRAFLTRAGLEQATRAVVAVRRAARLADAGVRALADLGCGLGADLRAVTAAGIRGYGVDADPVTAACAALNAPDAHVTCGDARDFDLSTVDAAFCDPARRSGGRRVFRPEDYSPPWDWVAALPQRVPHTVLKLAPGIDQELLPPGAELELVSVDGDVVEAAAWCGPLAWVPRRATVLRAGTAHELTGSGTETAPVGGVGAYVTDPDGAVVRAHLVAEFAAAHDGRLADPSIAYVYTDRPVTSPFGRCFAIDEAIPFSLKRLRAALRDRQVGRLEILKRGSALDVEQLRRDLRLSGPNPASLLLTRTPAGPLALLTHPATP
ncbi:methyltransferase domain-containing protein [Catellatospora sp. KI3]|uniref:class I SAM-dependent methyltransferase n=1 Tax=Catellatospora sp. KI3 TaxID=3041620 RepID=UPI0024831C49|nr:methyltransferase domain-containing protein [Catellatospora sp. KI3]MDI1460319.1 methyltransferase domain-containing protein [Catellatospora sp. KI3]